MNIEDFGLKNKLTPTEVVNLRRFLGDFVVNIRFFMMYNQMALLDELKNCVVSLLNRFNLTKLSGKDFTAHTFNYPDGNSMSFVLESPLCEDLVCDISSYSPYEIKFKSNVKQAHGSECKKCSGIVGRRTGIDACYCG